MKLHTITETKRCPSCGKPFQKDEPYPDVQNCETCERYGSPVKEDFDYSVIAKSEWQDITSKAQKEFGIFFDTENDEKINDRTIKIDDNKFYCEMWKAGGDWQRPICYFRCEIKDGFVNNPYKSQYTHPHFVYIPGINEGNHHLTKTKANKWSAPDDESGHKSDKKSEPNERLCWESLKKYLKKLSK